MAKKKRKKRKTNKETFGRSNKSSGKKRPPDKRERRNLALCMSAITVLMIGGLAFSIEEGFKTDGRAHLPLAALVFVIGFSLATLWTVFDWLRQ